MTPIVLTLTPELAGHIAIALELHRRWWTQPGRQLPDGLDELARAMRDAATSGQEQQQIDNVVDLDQIAPVPLAYSYEDAARLLRCSARKVRRLVTDGELTAVRLGGLVRIRRADLNAYLAAAPTNGSAA